MTSAEVGWTVVFDGRTIAARPGQSVGAALTDAGVRSWRSTRRQQRPRGLFCGIGSCYDCLITVDGQPNQRACLIPVRPGMHLDSHGPTPWQPVGDGPSTSGESGETAGSPRGRLRDA